jgi:predicted dehydrogenase
MKKILIIGGGSIGKRHMRNLMSIGQKNLVVVEPNENRAKEDIDSQYPDVRTVRSVEEAFAEQSFDIVFVCSPSIHHMKQALIAVENGCDIFVEKPLSHSMKDVDILLSQIKEKKLVTMLGSNWKFYPLFQKMKALLDSQTFGRVLSVRAQFGSYLPDWHPWEDHKDGYSANKSLGGGVLLESHEFDYVTWFLGPVKKLACFADRVSDVTVDTEDVAAVMMQFESGAIGELHFDYIQRFNQRDFEFFGTDGSLQWDVNKNMIEWQVVGGQKQSFSLAEGYDINEMYVQEIEHFLACVEKRKATITPLHAGATVLSLICAAKESAKDAQVKNF